ncbi:MAG: hypothetical protein JNK72_19900 [Myxococcales bacterium]|nr:hypothetical protein [Myxococcales bacterium]
MKKTVLGIVAACTVLGAAMTASAQTRYPLEFNQRPITLPARTLRIDGDLQFNATTASVTTGGVTQSTTSVATSLLLGGGIGLTDDLELGGLIAPIQLNPEARYGNPSVYGRYRIARGPTELSLDGAFVVPTRSGEVAALQLGASALIRTLNAGRFDLGGHIRINFSDPTSTDFIVPVRYAFQVNPQTAIGVSTGLFVPNNFKFDFATIPLGVFGRLALPGVNGTPVADIVAAFDFNNFIQFGGSDAVSVGSWAITLGGRFYLGT